MPTGKGEIGEVILEFCDDTRGEETRQHLAPPFASHRFGKHHIVLLYQQIADERCECERGGERPFGAQYRPLTSRLGMQTGMYGECDGEQHQPSGKHDGREQDNEPRSQTQGRMRQQKEADGQ